MQNQRHLSAARRAFTLIELVIVMSILAILAAIAIPQFSNGQSTAAVATLSTNVDSIRGKAAAELARTGEWPASIDSAWFLDGEPDHPQNDVGVPMVQVVSVPGMDHPAHKVLKAGVGGAYWYNAAEGVFRARIADLGSEAATLAAYNEVNDCDESALGNYGGGGGGGS